MLTQIKIETNDLLKRNVIYLACADANNEKRIVFDQAHNNSIEIETSAYTDFVQLFFQQDSFKIGKIMEEINYNKLKDYDLLILGNPLLPYSDNEINAILKFVNSGGNLLIVSDQGGDLVNQTNTCELLRHFGFYVLPNIIFDPASYVDKVVWPIVKRFNTHPVTSEVSSIVVASGCTIELMEKHDFAAYTEFLDVNVKPLAVGSLTAKMKVYDVSTRQWVEQTAKEAIISLAGSYKNGRFVVIPSCSMLSSLNKNYGLKAKDNEKYVTNAIRWLLEKRDLVYSPKVIGDQIDLQMRIDKELFLWANQLTIIKEWGDFSSIVNYSLRLLKKTIQDKQREMEQQSQEQSGESGDSKKSSEDLKKMD
jgi:hypothetical protein